MKTTEPQQTMLFIQCKFPTASPTLTGTINRIATKYEQVMPLKAKRHCTENPEVAWVFHSAELVSLLWWRQQRASYREHTTVSSISNICHRRFDASYHLHKHMESFVSIFTWSINTAVYLWWRIQGTTHIYLLPPEANTSLHLHCSATEQSWESCTHCPNKLYPSFCIRSAACRSYSRFVCNLSIVLH